MARENCSIGALYNITKNQHNPRKTLHKQTNKQTDKQTDTTKIMVTWP